ncbi:L10-interacting MYB domain-containing protein-like isoform X2 [Miscanthus floridulus]|uniref:L10-interacting MYB domain-containing protein-like isoform X2 n=1 Tax=Miscanthus floridulus TaxID=154761 RepID=UPI00345797A2
MQSYTQMDRGRAHWDNHTTRMFLDLCIAEKEKENYNSKGLTKIGWHNLYRNFKEHTRRVYDTKQLQNKFNSLKRMYNLWRQQNDKTRGEWDKNSSTVTQDADACDNQIAENSAAEDFRGKALAHEDVLTILFGSMDGKDSTKLCVGGTGDRTPSGGGEDNHARVSEDNIGCPEENVGCYRIGHVSQWSSQEHMVDSRPTKRYKNTGYYGELISESMLESRNESNAIWREQEEVTELLQLVEKDGVSQGSELFFIATELFRSPVRRAAFRCITTPKNRIAWLRWTWDNVKM